MEGGNTKFSEYSKIMAAVDSAIEESYYKMISEKMMTEFKESSVSKCQSAKHDTNCHTPAAPKESQENANRLTTDGRHKRHDVQVGHIDEQNNKSGVGNIKAAIPTPNGTINVNVFDKNTIHTSDNDENCLESNDTVRDNHSNLQADYPTLMKQLESQSSMLDNDGSAGNSEIKSESECIGSPENQTNPISMVIKKEIDTNQTTENEVSDSVNNKDGTVVSGGNEKGINCRDCGTTFPNAYQLSLHKRTVPECGSSSITRTYRCQLCERLFSSSSRLRKHLRTHLGTKPYKCNICQKQFTQSHNLKRHILIHTGEQPFQCMICKQSFTCAANTKRHIRVKHAKEVDATPDPEAYVETLVKRTTPTSISLKDESLATIIDIPAEESEEIIMPKRRKFGSGNVCLICDRKFTRSSHLRDHMHSHTGERPYQCHICDYNTNFKSGLNKHLRIHTGVKPHACAFCEDILQSVGS